MTYEEWTYLVAQGEYSKETVPAILRDWGVMIDRIEEHIYFTWNYESDQYEVRNIINKQKGEMS